MNENVMKDSEKSIEGLRHSIQTLLSSFEMPPEEQPLSLIFHSSNETPMVQIHDSKWLVEFKEVLKSDDQIVHESQVPLESAVLALYHWASRNSGPFEEHERIIEMLDELRERLMYCAILARIDGDEERYFELFPTACLGEGIVLPAKLIDEMIIQPAMLRGEIVFSPAPTGKVHGHLCEWHTRERRCVVSYNGHMLKLDGKLLKDGPLVLCGETGKLHQRLLRRYFAQHN
ncbi:hypothetical protein PV08_09002 [Exophiala spinifera]|uniref:Uncharacterized protein n=1 Tax=Exophiala spinifera TaxID=91928 RepID=A0A0D2B532_9EURO|nr:uncharacterized protein PV08_09002 [Exophiala spinifera]KIW13810.1 hypothetical protein PV08_09002 [Exophiala spinifera]